MLSYELNDLFLCTSFKDHNHQLLYENIYATFTEIKHQTEALVIRVTCVKEHNETDKKRTCHVTSESR